MPFVVPQQQQPERQKSTSMPSDHREQAPQPQSQSQQYGPAYRPPQQQQQRGGGGYDPWQQQRQQQYRQPMQQRQQYQQAPQPQRGRDSYGQRGGGRQYQQPMPQPYSTRPQRQYEPQMRQESMYSNRPQQGNYVGEGVYADGTPMPRGGGMEDSYGTANYRPNNSGGTPKMSDEEFAANQRSLRIMSPGSSYGQPSPSYNGQSLIQSNSGPAGGVYSNFSQTPDVIGGVTPRAYLEEDDVYSKPMRVGRGGGGIY